MLSFKLKLIGTENDSSVAVINMFGRKGERRLTGYFSLFTVGQGDQTCKGQRAFGTDQTTTVVQIPALQVNGHGTLADQAALALNQLLESFDENGALLTLELPAHRVDALKTQLRDATRNRVHVVPATA